MIWNFCIKRPVFTVVIFLAIAIFGIYGYLQLAVREYPDVDFPIVNVTVILEGADPGVVETEVIEPLEEQLNTIEGVKKIISTSREEVGSVTVEFELYRNIDIAAQDVRDRVSRARPDMAAEIEEPVVRKIDPDARPVMWIALTGDRRWDMVRITEFAENQIKEQLEGLPGVGQIRIGGERRYAVRIELEPDKLAAYRLTAQEVASIIRRENVEIPSGRIESRMREFLVKTEGRFSSAAPFNRLILAYRQGGPIRLEDLGHAADGVEDDRTVARFNREPSVGLGIVKQSEANMVEMVERVRGRLSDIRRNLPPGLAITIASDDSVYVNENINDLLRTIFMATGLVVCVILLFLGTLRGTFVTTVVIPTSLLGGLAAMYYLDFSLNVVSMLSLILVIGIVVDDAVVVLESCFRHVQAGAAPIPAARTGTTEIAFAAIANTLSLAAVFIPVAFTPGLIGRFFSEFGLTVAVTVAFSTFTALTLTPMLCSRMLSATTARHPPLMMRAAERLFESSRAMYRPLLKSALRWRWITVGAGLAALGAGLLAFVQLEMEFIPGVDRGEFVVSFETVEGATLTATDQHARQIENIFSQVPEIKSYFLAIGLGRTGPGKVNEGISFVRLSHRDERRLSQHDIMQRVRERIAELPGVRGYVLEQVGPLSAEAPIQLVLKNPDLEKLARQQAAIMRWMRSQPAYVGVNTNMKLDKPEVRVRIDRDRAAELDITVAEIANTLRLVFGDPKISTIDRRSERYDVITQIARRETIPDTVNQLYVRNAGDRMIPLSGLVQTTEGTGPSEIHHFNRGRASTISAQNPPGVALGAALTKLRDHLDTALPSEFEATVSGTAQEFEESFYYLTITLILAVIFVYLVLAAQFESFLHPFTILITLPLASMGVFVPLALWDMNFSIFAFIGLIFLVGLVTKTGILLVDYTNVLVARGLSVREAVQQAAETRFRPVVMTASSSILGMLPIAVGYGAGGEARAPMGVVIALGNFVSTSLTLLVIPVVYTLIDDLQNIIRRHPRLSMTLFIGFAVALAAGGFLYWRIH
jgi:hydrophobe/amphiphile efflux-1 (HAE1) family protein